MDAQRQTRLGLAVSDQSELSSLRRWLASIDGARVTTVPADSVDGQQGVSDTLAMIAGSGGLIAAIRMLPEFLRARRSDVSVTVTVKDRQVTITAHNIEEAVPLLERILHD